MEAFVDSLVPFMAKGFAWAKCLTCNALSTAMDYKHKTVIKTLVGALSSRHWLARCLA